MSLPGLFGTAIGQDAQGDGGGEGGDPSRLPVKDKDLTAPPGAPSVGDRYIVASVATGAWTGHEDDIAEWAGAAWTFETPVIGWIVYVDDETEYYSWNGAAWVMESAGPHASTHEDGGTDELSVEELATAGAANTVPKGDGAGGLAMGNVAHAETTGVTADQHHAQDHAASHRDGGADEVTVEDLATAGAAGRVPISDGAGGLAMGAPAPASHAIGGGAHSASTPAAINALVTGDSFQVVSEKSAANGYPSLDATAKVPTSELPASVLGDVAYQGAWNATTNTPTLASGVGTKGYYYKVSVAGSTNLDGITDWKIGDMPVFNGATWDKIDNTESVTSVFGRLGAVVAAADDYTHAQLDAIGTDDHHAKAHDLGGADHAAATLAELNAKVSDATMDDSGDPRDPNAHAASHQDGGSDEISVAGLSGALADAQTPSAHAVSHKDGGSDELDVEELASAGAADAIATSNGSGAVSMIPHDPVTWYDAARLDSPDGTSDVPGSMVAAPIANDSIASNIPVREFPDDVEKGVLLGSTVRIPPGATVMQLHIAGHAKIAPTPSATTLVLKMYTRKHKNGVARGTWGAASSVATFSIPTNTYDVIALASKTLNAWNLLPGEDFQICISRDPLDASDDLVGDFELRQVGLEIY